MRVFDRSNEMLKRAEKLIPLGSQTFSKSHIAYPKGRAPLFLERGRGSHVWDVDGNEFIDFISGLLPVTLGYDDPDVTAAVVDQIKRGVSFTLATPLEIELAQLLVDVIPCAEMVRFGKNGSDATAACIRLARAFTGRDRVAACGYHGWQDWYIGATTRSKGVPRAVRDLTQLFPYNDLGALERLLAEHRGEFACIIMEPMNVEDPKPGFLQGVKELAHKHGALLVFDEIITGFRFALGGAQELFGVTPDLAAFGKGMANGYPISAVVGRADVMREMEEIFFSFTFGGEAASLAASLATINKMRAQKVIEHLWRQGGTIMGSVTSLIARHDLQDVLRLVGKPCWSLISVSDAGPVTSWQIKTLFMQEMIARGILIQGSHNLSFAHGDAELSALIDAWGEVLPIIADAVHNGAMSQHLRGPAIEPVFRVR